jgi:DNA polymerase-3 subunit delta'
MEIIVTNNLERAAEELGLNRVVIRNVIRLEDVEKVREWAVLGSGEEVKIGLGGERIPAVVQNSLLKLLEEPPAGVKIFILTPSKYQILETVRSRLPVRELKFEEEEEEIDLSRVDILEFLSSNPSTGEVKRAIYTSASPRLSASQWEMLGKALELLELNGNREAIALWSYLILRGE